MVHTRLLAKHIPRAINIFLLQALVFKIFSDMFYHCPASVPTYSDSI